MNRYSDYFCSGSNLGDNAVESIFQITVYACGPCSGSTQEGSIVFPFFATDTTTRVE